MFKRILILTLLIISVLTLTACDEMDISVYSMLNNQSKEPYYLWVGHRRATDSDFVAIGGFRQISLTLQGKKNYGDVPNQIRDEIKVNASRNLEDPPVTQVLMAQEDYSSGKQFYIRWNGAGFSLDYQ
jgi:hypothetical protein